MSDVASGYSAYPSSHDAPERRAREFRVFLEEICCNLCRFLHVERDAAAPEAVRIEQEYPLGVPGAFADISVRMPGGSRYFVEVKHGFPTDRLVSLMLRKYGPASPGARSASKVVLVIDLQRRDRPEEALRAIESGLAPGLALEVWDEPTLSTLIRERFDADVGALGVGDVHDLRRAIDGAKGRYAFGDEWEDSHLQAALLWHFGFWRLKQLRDQYHVDVRGILPPATYPRVVAVIADLCAFSSYVRDTRDDEVVRQCLTMFYSKARYNVLNSGGMMYQFAGDQVIGLFGLPDRAPGYLDAAIECAMGLVNIGLSISNEWQRRIDRQQDQQGVHIGMAIGGVVEE